MMEPTLVPAPIMDPFFIFVSATHNKIHLQVDQDPGYVRVKLHITDLYDAYVDFFEPFVGHQFWHGDVTVIKATLLPKAGDKLHEARLKSLFLAQKNPEELTKLDVNGFVKRLSDEFKGVVEIYKASSSRMCSFSLQNIKAHLQKKLYQTAYDEHVCLSKNIKFERC